MEKGLQTKQSSGVSLIEKFAGKYNIEATKMIAVLKGTVMKPTKDGKTATNEELAGFLAVSTKYNLDPFTKEIYAFVDKRAGIVPIIGVDGYHKIMTRHPKFDGFEFRWADEMIIISGSKKCPEWGEIVIYRTDTEHPVVIREYLDEVYVPARGGFSGPWQSHTKRMLRHKLVAQGVRSAFGITGVYDEDEANRIIEAQVIKEEVPEPQIIGLKTHKTEPQATISEDTPEDPSKKKKVTAVDVKMFEAKAKLKEMFPETWEKMWYDGLGELGVEHCNELPDDKTKKGFTDYILGIIKENV